MKQEPKNSKKLVQGGPSKMDVEKKQGNNNAIVCADEDEKIIDKYFGGVHPESFGSYISQAVNAHPVLGDPDAKDIAGQILSSVIGVKPQDELEFMLAVQAVGAHNLSMEMMSRAAAANRTEAVDAAVNRATKLSRTFVALIEALNKHRGRGGQKMTVEHVHVNKGGKAVIGNKK